MGKISVNGKSVIESARNKCR